MAKITITYTAPVAPAAQSVSPICRMFTPDGCAADHPNMAGTYYDTNVDGWGEGTPLAAFMAQMVAHPGLLAAVKQAIQKGTYVLENADDKTVLYVNEVGPALVEEGLTFEVGE